MDNECPLCDQQYSDSNPPRLLVNCGHTYCEKCFGKMITQNKGSFVIICPEDGQMITLKDNKISNLPKNIALLKILESKRNNSSFKDPDLQMSKIVKNQQIPHEDDEARDLVNALAYTNNLSIGNDQKTIMQKQQSTKADAHQEKTTKQPKTVQLCRAHQKPLQVVCVIDLKKICVNCAIFGDHKGHEFKSLQQIQSQRMAYYSAILQIMQKKQTINSRISNQQTCSSIMELLSKKKSKMKNSINQKFKKLIQNIQSKQKESLKNLDILMHKTQNKLKNLMRIEPQILQKYDTWQQKSFEQIKILQGNDFQAKLQLIFTDNTEQVDVLQLGDVIVSQMNKQQQNLINEVELALQNIGVDFNLEIFNHIDGFIDIYDEIKKKKPKARMSKVESQSILPSLYQSNSSKISSVQRRQQNTIIKQQSPNQKTNFTTNYQKNQKLAPRQPLKHINILTPQQDLLQTEYESAVVNKPQFVKTEQIHIEKQPQQIQSPLRKQKNALSPNSKIISSVSIQLSPRGSKVYPKQQSFVNQKIDKPNKKKIMNKLKLSQKYQKILDGVLNDQLDTVDFTNAQLGDNTIICISQLILGTKAKTVKFIRNKLTDDAVFKIIPYMKNVVTLNLSQNLLTQKVLDVLIQKRAQLESIKTVILSQNKIIQRKAKLKMQKLKSLDIIISL